MSVIYNYQWRIQDLRLGGTNPKEEKDAYLLFSYFPNFPRNWMEMNKIGPGGHPKCVYVDPPLITVICPEKYGPSNTISEFRYSRFKIFCICYEKQM